MPGLAYKRVCGLFAVLLIVLGIWRINYRTVTAELIQQKISQEIPIGTTRKEVQDWLKKNHIRWLRTVNSSGKETDDYLYAEITDTGGENEEIRISFWFGEQSNLIRYEVELFVASS